MLDEHIVDGDAQFVGHDLCDAGFVTLAVRLRAGGHHNFAGQMDAHIGAFPQASAPALHQANRSRPTGATPQIST